MSSVTSMRDRLQHLGVYLPPPQKKPITRAEIIEEARQRGEVTAEPVAVGLIWYLTFSSSDIFDLFEIEALFANAYRPEAAAKLVIFLVLSLGLLFAMSLFGKAFGRPAVKSQSYTSIIRMPKHYRLGTKVLLGACAICFAGGIAALAWGPLAAMVRDPGTLATALFACSFAAGVSAHLEDKTAWRRYARDLEESPDLIALAKS